MVLELHQNSSNDQILLRYTIMKYQTQALLIGSNSSWWGTNKLQLHYIHSIDFILLSLERGYPIIISWPEIVIPGFKCNCNQFY